MPPASDLKEILLVEDEVVIAMSEKAWLQREGFKVHHVSSGEEAIVAVQRTAGNFDLILMDIDLGQNKMNGTDAAARILQKYNIPLIFLSSHTEKEVVSLTEKITSYGYVTKGSGDAVLLASINMAFRLHAAHKKLEAKDKALRKSENKYRHLFENMTSAFVLHEVIYDVTGQPVDFRIIDSNPAADKLMGAKLREVYGKTLSEISPGIKSPWLESSLHVLKTGEPLTKLNYSPRLDKYLHAILFSPEKGQLAIIAVDVTDRVRAENEIQLANRLYAFISQINQTIVRTRDKELLFSEACRIAVEHGKFRMAWIGLVDETEHAVKPCAWAGFEEGYLEKIKTISISDMPEGRGPTGTAIREGRYFLCNDIENDPKMNIWRQEALSRGYRASLTFPVIVFGRVIGAFSLYSSEPSIFNEREILLLQEVTGDIAYALENLEKEKKHRQTEIEQKESELKYKHLVEQASDGIFISDKTGRYIDVNPSGCKMMGYSREELLRLTMSDLVQKEDMEQKPLQIEPMLRGESVKTERMMIRKDKSAFPAEITGRMIDGGLILGFVRDISERRKAEEEIKKNQFLLKSIIEGSTDAIYIKDLNGRYLMCNSATARFVGRSKDEIIGRDDSFLFPENEARQIMQQDHEIMISRKAHSLEEAVMMKNGSIRYFLTIKGPVVDERGMVHGLFGFAKDITERKLNELQLAKNAEEMQALNSTKDKLLSIVAHDLRGPFMGFVGLTDDLSIHINELGKDEITEYAHVLNSTARKINELLSNLLEWSRLQTGKIEFEPVEIDLFKMTDNVISLFSSSAAGKSITILNQISDGICISADINMTSTILRNLISNAIKFTGSGGSIELSAACRKDFVEVKVADTGIGMSDMVLKKIFRTDTIFTSKGTKQEEGSGFGLVLCREMVEKHGGRMDVKTEQGRGSTFSFTLPAA